MSDATLNIVFFFVGFFTGVFRSQIMVELKKAIKNFSANQKKKKITQKKL